MLRIWNSRRTLRTVICGLIVHITVASATADADILRTIHIVCLFRYQVQAVASLLQSILKQLSSEKEERKYRTVFVFGCMERLTKLLRNHRLQGMIDFTICYP